VGCFEQGRPTHGWSPWAVIGSSMRVDRGPVGWVTGDPVSRELQPKMPRLCLEILGIAVKD
jgi:hypothetical protein